MTFAFSRDKAIPGSQIWSRSRRPSVCPRMRSSLLAVVAALVTLPALIEVNIGTAAEPL